MPEAADLGWFKVDVISRTGLPQYLSAGCIEGDEDLLLRRTDGRFDGTRSGKSIRRWLWDSRGS